MYISVRSEVEAVRLNTSPCPFGTCPRNGDPFLAISFRRNILYSRQKLFLPAREVLHLRLFTQQASLLGL